MSQFTRDARITMIYEGANGVQALDLVGRNLGQNGGRYVRDFDQICTTLSMSIQVRMRILNRHLPPRSRRH